MTVKRERPANANQMYFSDIPRDERLPIRFKYSHPSTQKEDQVNAVVVADGRTRNLQIDGETYQSFFLGLEREIDLELQNTGSEMNPGISVFLNGERIDPQSRHTTTRETLRRRLWAEGAAPYVCMDKVAKRYSEAFALAVSMKAEVDPDGAKGFNPSEAATGILTGTILANLHSRPKPRDPAQADRGQNRQQARRKTADTSP